MCKADSGAPQRSARSWKCAACLDLLVEVCCMCKANADQRNNMLVSKRVNDTATVSVSGNQPSVTQEAQLMRSCRLRNRKKVLQLRNALLPKCKRTKNLKAGKVLKRIKNLRCIIDDIIVHEKFTKRFF